MTHGPTTNDQHPEPAHQELAQGTLGNPTESEEEHGHPSKHSPLPERDTWQQEDIVIGPTMVNLAMAPAPLELEQDAIPPVHLGDKAATVPTQQRIEGEDGLTPTDKLLETIYGDHIQANDGSQLDGRIATDHTWQLHW